MADVIVPVFLAVVALSLISLFISGICDGIGEFKEGFNRGLSGTDIEKNNNVINYTASKIALKPIIHEESFYWGNIKFNQYGRATYTGILNAETFQIEFKLFAYPHDSGIAWKCCAYYYTVSRGFDRSRRFFNQYHSDLYSDKIYALNDSFNGIKTKIDLLSEFNKHFA